jgi:L-aspartate oxidase
VADRYLGVRRSAEGLDAARSVLAGSGPTDDTNAPALIAWLLAAAARRREESRGGHFRVDFPRTVDAWAVHQVVTREGWGKLPAAMQAALEP